MGTRRRCRGFGSGLHCGIIRDVAGTTITASRCRGFGSGLHCGPLFVVATAWYDPLRCRGFGSGLHCGFMALISPRMWNGRCRGFGSGLHCGDQNGAFRDMSQTVAGVSAPAFIAGWRSRLSAA